MNTDGLTERFNQTLKQMLWKFVNDTGSDWDQWLPFLLSSTQKTESLLIRRVEEEDDGEEQYLPKTTPLDLELQHLSEDGQHEVRALCTPEVFYETPGLSHAVSHDTVLKEADELHWCFSEADELSDPGVVAGSPEGGSRLDAVSWDH